MMNKAVRMALANTLKVEEQMEKLGKNPPPLFLRTGWSRSEI
tara:strand:- start:367 stop:492 length:126 start_codon:yes stop_codon:yes gene_type:complete